MMEVRGITKFSFIKKFLPVLNTAILSSSFFWLIVLLDTIMRSRISLYAGDAISYLIVAAIVFALMFLLPEGPSKWGLNLKNWQAGLLMGVTSGLAFGMLSHIAVILFWRMTIKKADI